MATFEDTGIYDPTGRPGQEREMTQPMTFSDLLAILFSGEPFTADQSAHVTRWLAAERDRKQAIRDQVAGMPDVYRLADLSAMTHFDGRPVFPGQQVLVGTAPVGYVEQVGGGWRGTYEESYVGATRCTVRATKDEAAVDVVAELVFRKLPSQ